jgi:diguanylate cyclase (GGDEF)-like protein
MSLALLVGLQLLLYGVLWGLCAIAFRDERKAALLWMGYALVSGISVVLIGWRPEGPVWLTHTGVSLTSVLGLVLARRGVELFLRVSPHKLQYGAIVVLGGLAFFWIGPHEAAQRVGLSAWLNTALIVGAMLSCWRALHSEFGVRFCVAASVPLAAILLVNLKLGIDALQGHVIQIELPGLVQAMAWLISLVSAAVFNFLFLFLLAFRMQKSLYRQTIRDPLTGLLNRRGMQARLQSEWLRARRYGTVFAVISLDVDHFKRVNDEHGHDAGDRVLFEVAQLLTRTVRETDKVARMGGEEFLVLMPECDAGVQGLALAERVRTMLGQTPLPVAQGLSLRVTASLGVTDLLKEDASLDDVLRRADAAMYEGKRGGRDRVVLFASDNAVGGHTGE